MKTIRLFLITVVLSSLVGCSSSDDGPSGPQVSNDLYGEWTLDFLILNGEFEGNFECEEKIDYRFNSDNTYSKTEYITGSQGNCSESVSFSGEWEILQEQSIELTPNSPSISGETIDFEITDNEGLRLEISRSSIRTEVYQRP